MKTIHLFVDFEFTSLSPDAQPISIGVVSEDILTKQVAEDFLSGNNNPCLSKSFYAEFSDFDINRCGDWVKENVVGKLIYNEAKNTFDKFQYDAVAGNVSMKDSTSEIKGCLKDWLTQFSDYQITFVVDCGTWDWYHLLQLIGEWEENEREVRDGDEIYDITSEKGILISSMGDYELIVTTKTGLPNLPSNISPVPFELNQFIAEKKGISVREAFELDREAMCKMGTILIDENLIPKGVSLDQLIEELERTGTISSMPYKDCSYNVFETLSPKLKHNALWDAKVMKAIYEKLSV